MKIVEAIDVVLLTFPGEKDLKDEPNQKLGNLIFNSIVEVKETQECYIEIW